MTMCSHCSAIRYVLCWFYDMNGADRVNDDDNSGESVP